MVEAETILSVVVVVVVVDVVVSVVVSMVVSASVSNVMVDSVVAKSPTISVSLTSKEGTVVSSSSGGSLSS